MSPLDIAITRRKVAAEHMPIQVASEAKLRRSVWGYLRRHRGVVGGLCGPMEVLTCLPIVTLQASKLMLAREALKDIPFT